MWMLIRYELYKLWSQRMFYISLLVLSCINIFFFWNSDRAGVSKRAQVELGIKLEQLEPDQRLSYLETQEQKLYSIYQLEYYIQNGYSNPENPYYSSFLELWDNNGTAFREGEYLTYTDNASEEYLLFLGAYEEATYVSSFENRLNSIQNAANSLSQISIFQHENYNQKNIKKTAEDYAGLKNVSPQFQLQKCWYNFTDYVFTDYILIIMIIFCSFFIIRQEQENGILFYLWSTPSGRIKLALTKWATFCISILLIISILYGVTGIWCIMNYPFGNLNVPVQSLAFLRDCPLKVSIGQYLLLYLGIKFLTSCILGTFLLLCALWGSQIYTSYLPAVGFLTISNLLYSVIPAYSILNMFKYCNLFGLLRTNSVLSEYQNLYLFGNPISKWKAQFIFGVTFFLLFGILFLILFEKKQRSTSNHFYILKFFKMRSKGPRRKAHVGVVSTEFYKTFVKNGVLFILIIFGIFQTYHVLTYEDYQSPEELQYNVYMKNLSGPYGKEQYNWLLQKQKKFEPLSELESAFSSGKITEEQYEAGLLPLYPLQSEYTTFQSAVAHIAYLKEHSGAQFINETAYSRLFNLQSDQDQIDALVAAVLCVFCCAGVFALDYSSGMIRVIAATPNGRKKTVASKVIVALCISILISCLISFPQLVIVERDFGLTSLLGSAYSLQQFQNLPKSFTVSDLLLSWLLTRIFVVFVMSLVMLCISNAVRDTMKSVFIGLFIFCIPLLLAQELMPALGWLTIYPGFHFVTYISDLYAQGWSLLGSALWQTSLAIISLLSIVPFFGTYTTFSKWIWTEVLEF